MYSAPQKKKVTKFKQPMRLLLKYAYLWGCEHWPSLIILIMSDFPFYCFFSKLYCEFDLVAFSYISIFLDFFIWVSVYECFTCIYGWAP